MEAGAVTRVTLEEKVAFLRRPGSYPHDAAEVDAIETHMAWVFLAGTEAYKLKKPVRYDFLDFSTLEARREDCHVEVRLNRRLAPDVYRGVDRLWRKPSGQLSLESGAEVVEWLVHMRRLPKERMLDVRIREGGVSPRQVRRVVERLARFYETVPRMPLTGEEYRTRFREDVRECGSELEELGSELPLDIVSSVEEGLVRFLSRRSELLDARVEEGRIVEGHGDLRPEHICLEDEPVIIDCLEFNREFRTVDPADELSFLSLECARLGAPALGDSILDEYGRLSGDRPPSELLDFYRSFRAFLRAKITAWHTRDDALRDDHRTWIDRTREYLGLALDSLPTD